jgi:hypothetical protein
MSIRSFMETGKHYGKLAERQSANYGLIELFNIGEPDTVGAYYNGDKSRQAQPANWHGSNVMQTLEKLVKVAKAKPPVEQTLIELGRPKLGKPSLAAELRRLSMRGDVFIMPTKVERDHAPPTPGQIAARQEFAARVRRKRVVEKVEIPKDAEDKLRAALKDFGPCKAIRILAATFPDMNKTSVIAVAGKAGIHKSTAGVQFAEQKRQPKSVDELTSKSKGKASTTKRSTPIAKADPTKPSRPRITKFIGPAVLVPELKSKRAKLEARNAELTKVPIPHPLVGKRLAIGQRPVSKKTKAAAKASVKKVGKGKKK